MAGRKGRRRREGEERRKGGKEMGRDLPDQCQTTSYTRL